MKKAILIVIIFVFNIHIHAQINFEKGYIINNGGNKIECLIKNVDWLNNPTEFEYKVSETSKVITANINNIEEFVITGVSKYKRFVVEIDRSSAKIDELDYSSNFKFNKETLFLKSLIEGKATLYTYKDKDLKRFFYTVDGLNITTLNYKQYLYKVNLIGVNNTFKQQIFTKINCGNVSMNVVKKLKYEKKDFVNYFTKYNKCNNSVSVNFEKKKKSNLNINIRPGVSFSSLFIDNPIVPATSSPFDKSSIGFRLGLEFEYVFPFNKNKWAMLFEPSYRNIKIEQDYAIFSRNEKVTFDYQPLELSFGVRHYFFLNDTDSKLFINATYIRGFPFSSSINSRYLSLRAAGNVALGFGYKFKKKFGLELNYGFDRDVVNEFSSRQDSKFNTLSFIFSYQLSKNKNIK